MQTIQVKVKTRASEDKVEGFKNKVLHVKVKEAPDKGKANIALMKLLRDHFNKRAEIISGHTSRKKLVRLHELS